MLSALTNADQLLAEISNAIQLASNQTLIIGIDGRPGSGKSSVASWLGWQLGLLIIPLDVFIIPGSDPPEWHYQDLGHAFSAMTGRAVIVEGACLCQVMQALDRDPDFLVWMERRDGPEHGPEELTDDYMREFNPVANMDFTLVWS